MANTSRVSEVAMIKGMALLGWYCLAPGRNGLVLSQAQIGKLAGVDLWVDFRRQNCVHWKLYLLAPSDVIIGSPNFTGRGLATNRDIAGVVHDAEFYSGLDERIGDLLKTPRVTKFGTTAFDREMAQYTVDFDISQQRRRASGVSGAPGSVEDWLSDEGNQELKLYVWTQDHPEVRKRRARRMATKGRQAGGMPISPRSPLRESLRRTVGVRRSRRGMWSCAARQAALT